MIRGRGVGGGSSSMRVVRVRLRIGTIHLGVLRVIVRLHGRTAPATSAIIIPTPGSTTARLERAGLGMMALAGPLGRSARRGRGSLVRRPVLLRLRLRVGIWLIAGVMIGGCLGMLLRRPLWLRRRIAAGRRVLRRSPIRSRVVVLLGRVIVVGCSGWWLGRLLLVAALLAMMMATASATTTRS